MSTSTRVHIMLPPDTLMALDMARGLVSRSAYVRDLVEKDLAESKEWLSKMPVVEEPSLKRQVVVTKNGPHRCAKNLSRVLRVEDGMKGRIRTQTTIYGCVNPDCDRELT